MSKRLFIFVMPGVIVSLMWLGLGCMATAQLKGRLEPKGPEIVKVEMLTWIDKTNQVSIQYPKDWPKETPEEGLLLVTAPPDAEFKAKIFVYKDELEKETTAKGYAELMADWLQKNYTNYTELALEPMEIEGEEAMKRIYTWVEPERIIERSMEALEGYFVRGTTGFSVICQTDLATYKQLEPLFEQITLSFRFTGIGAPPSPLITPHQLVVLKKPGVVFIQSVVKGNVVLPAAGTDPNTGQVVPTEQMYTREVQYSASGSGFVITPDGYIITNAHVVSFHDELVIYNLVDSAIGAEFDEFKETAGREPNKEEQELIADYVIRYARVTDIQKSTYVALGVTIPGVAMLGIARQADIRKLGSSIDDIFRGGMGNDVAIIKIAQDNLATVKLGDSDDVKLGDRIFVIGYPGVATFHPLLEKTSEVESTLTAGIVSAEKTTKGGFEVFQTDAAMTHGNSGGPAFNEKGEVIGIATFGSIDLTTGQEVAGFNFLIPINLAKEFMHEMNIINTRGSVDEHFEEGMRFFWNEQYDEAIEELEIVTRLYPGHPSAQKYITEAQGKL